MDTVYQHCQNSEREGRRGRERERERREKERGGKKGRGTERERRGEKVREGEWGSWSVGKISIVWCR